MENKKNLADEINNEIKEYTKEINRLNEMKTKFFSSNINMTLTKSPSAKISLSSNIKDSTPKLKSKTITQSTKSILILSPRKIDKVYKSVYFSEKKSPLNKTSIRNTVLKETSQEIGKGTFMSNKKEKKYKRNPFIEQNPYFQEILHHNKTLSKSQSNKEINVKTY